MSGDNCSICGRGKLHTTTGVYETSFSDRNGAVHDLRIPGVTWRECDSCKEVFLDDAASRQIEAARRNASGLLSPTEIRQLRLRLNKSQSQMSQLLGIGEKTYCRWESGAYVQSTAFDRYLRLLIERPENVEVLEMLERTTSSGPSVSRPEQVRLVFSHLRDSQGLEDAAEAFTRLLEVGGLHAVQ
jgi:putative zinc finger/helix-turn-helix YgiT family protein